jgi:hypothetical protein
LLAAAFPPQLASHHFIASCHMSVAHLPLMKKKQKDLPNMTGPSLPALSTTHTNLNVVTRKGLRSATSLLGKLNHTKQSRISNSMKNFIGSLCSMHFNRNRAGPAHDIHTGKASTFTEYAHIKIFNHLVMCNPLPLKKSPSLHNMHRIYHT